MLLPLYQNIKGLIKHLKNNEITKLLKEFEVTQTLVNTEQEKI